MENFRNKVEIIGKDRCEAIASELYKKISGLTKAGPNFERLQKNSEEIRARMEKRIDGQVVHSYYSDIALEGKELTVGGAKFSCPAFEQINPGQVQGVYVYLLTAGDFSLEDEPIMNQLLADLWGTAFTDAVRVVYEETIEKDKYLSNSFGPGLYGMNTAQMCEMPKLLDGSLIDIEIKESGLLVPVKSCGGMYFAMDRPFEKIEEACEDCKGTVSSCNICNVQKNREIKAKEEKEVENKEGKSKAFKCTGVCSSCGRCKDAGIIAGANKRKTELLMLPDDYRPETGEQGYGIAFDIGTTTVVGMLIDLYTGKEVGALAKTNPQNAHGLDVISRITFSEQEDGNLNVLHDEILGCLNDILDELCARTGIDKDAVLRGTVCGNTTMSHLFAGYSPSSLARVPFEPAYKGTLLLKGKQSGIKIASEGAVMLFPNIAGHVGGDITSGILASRLLNEEKLTLFLDIGTNGEIVICDGKKVLACSTAAGPAFEGAAIYQGMRAAPGAIERIKISRDGVLFGTVEDAEPVGICGSGLIDAVAQMIDAALIKKTGRIFSAEEFKEKSPGNKLCGRLREGKQGREFVLVFKETGEDIVITQNDIREVQLAKGAISAGIAILLKKLEKSADGINKIIMAGAFGSFIDKRSAVRIGLLPNIDMAKILSAGNTAGAGSLMAVSNADEAVTAKKIPGLIQHIELAGEKDFQEKFISAMSFR